MAKVLVSLPDELVARLDAEAKRRETTRSSLLALAAERELERQRSDKIDAAIARSRAYFASVGSFNSEDLIDRLGEDGVAG